MTWKDCLQKHRNVLVEKFGEGESNAMLRILKEDYIVQFDKTGEDALLSSEVLALERIISSILEGFPIQYAIGIALFNGMKLKVTPNVLIPRPETEELLHWAKDLLFDHSEKKYIDIGTGSGCLALGMKKEAPNAQILAMDKSKEAIKVASSNSESTALSVNFHCFDILDKTQWDALPTLNGIISNPPYIPVNELVVMGESVVKHEPEMALMVSNEDPLIFYRTIGEFAQEKLAINGWLLFEINEFYGEETVDLLKRQGFRNVELRQDMQGKDRMIGCWK